MIFRCLLYSLVQDIFVQLLSVHSVLDSRPSTFISYCCLFGLFFSWNIFFMFAFVSGLLFPTMFRWNRRASFAKMFGRIKAASFPILTHLAISSLPLDFDLHGEVDWLTGKCICGSISVLLFLSDKMMQNAWSKHFSKLFKINGRLQFDMEWPKAVYRPTQN